MSEHIEMVLANDLAIGTFSDFSLVLDAIDDDMEMESSALVALILIPFCSFMYNDKYSANAPWLSTSS